MTLTPAQRLIVALDLPPADATNLVNLLYRHTEVHAFKIGVPTLLAEGGHRLAQTLGHAPDITLMLDLKLYDQPDTVRRAVAAAHALGATFLTVHVHSIAAAASIFPRPRLLVVNTLTCDGPQPLPFIPSNDIDGLVCHPAIARFYRDLRGPDYLIVCPGIRPISTTFDDHIRPATPIEAIRAGADYIVVGRPITQAVHPIVAAQAIIDMMATVKS